MKRYIKLTCGMLDTSEFTITETKADSDTYGMELVKAYEFVHKQDNNIKIIVKESDILGEGNSLMPLCDLWVHERYGHKTIYKNYESAKRSVDNEWSAPSMDGHGEFYGLIWVDGIFGMKQPTLVPVCEVPFHSNGEAVLLAWKITREI